MIHHSVHVHQNYLDLAFLIARNSVCREGKVGCVLVTGVSKGAGSSKRTAQATAPDSILIAATNSELLRERSSDCHAEANAIALCARKGLATEACSAYVIIPPCKVRNKQLPCSCIQIQLYRWLVLTDVC
jgi:deoxycytidylate deaminase